MGSTHAAVTSWVAAILVLAASGWAGATRRPRWSWIFLSVMGYAGVVVLNTLFLSPAYTPAGLYHPLIFLVAFMAVGSLDDRKEHAVAIAGFLMGALLAAWGLLQGAFFDIARASAFFEAPATYAAAINLLLVPLLAAILLGRRGTPLLAVALLLSAALFCADSRGGLIALGAGLGATAILAMRVQRLRPGAIASVVAILMAGWLVSSTLRALPAPRPDASPSAELRAESSVSRLELYALSAKAWREQPIAGTGYLTFRYKLEQGRLDVPSYGATSETWFVHNDYLQVLQELGPLGLLALLGITGLPLILAYRRIAQTSVGDRLPVIASASALAAMSVHALVDFPFFIPVCLLLYGALLGALDRRLDSPAPAIAFTWASKPWFRPARAAVVALASIVLIRPVLAEASAEWGLRRSAAGEGQSAAIWLGAAQRLDAGDWRYHWYAGQFWDTQATQSGNREAARLAAEAYAAGFEANPLEVRNLLGMISVHRRHSALLDAPADARTLSDWKVRAAALAPLSPAVRLELAR